MMFFRVLFIPLGLLLLGGCGDTRLKDAASLHQGAIVIDTHSDFLDRSAIDGSHLSDDPIGAQTTLTKLKEGQVDAQFFSVFVPPAFEDYGFSRRADELIDRLYAEAAANSDDVEIVTSAAGIRRLANSGKIAALMGIEGGHAIEGDLGKLEHFYRRGVRYMTLSWANTNAFADSSGDAPRWGGLNTLGEQVVKTMNRLGMMVDISHVSDETFWDVMAVTTSPVIASHSDVRGIVDHKRNMGDKMIRAIADNGGVIQISFYAQYVDQNFADQFEVAKAAAKPRFDALKQRYGDDPVELDIQEWSLEISIEQGLTPPSVAKVVDHIDYVVKLGGIDHVGLGSDFDGMGAPPAGLENIGKVSAITDELVRRGYSGADVRKILGENLLRVLAQNESRAEQ